MQTAVKMRQVVQVCRVFAVLITLSITSLVSGALLPVTVGRRLMFACSLFLFVVFAGWVYCWCLAGLC